MPNSSFSLAKNIQLVIFYCSLLFGIWFLVRLADIQLVKGNSFLQASETNRQFSFALPSARGVFLDRYGDNLVYNHKQYYRYLDEQALFSKTEYLLESEAKQFMATASAYLPYNLARSYLHPVSLAHILGYLAPAQADDLANNRSLSITDRVGKLGLEAQMEPALRGVKGKEVFEVDTFGKKKRRLFYQEALAGEVLSTTLDPYLSEMAWLALAGKKGSVIIADAKNGELLAMVNSPSFDSNAMSNLYIEPEKELARKKQVATYLSDPDKVFFNRAISGAYPPGSIFKMLTALAGLESGRVNQHTIVRDEGILKVGDFEYANWYHTQYGRVEGDISLVRAIARSNDIYFYKIAEFAGVEAIANMARQFGLGKTTGVELRGEVAGLVPDPAWKEKVKGERWYLGNTYHLGIGQGDILLTPIQALQMTQAISNHASLCKPHLLKTDQQDCTELAIKDEHLNLILQGMLDACSSSGTAFPFFTHNTTYLSGANTLGEALNSGAVACKTGTAEFGGVDSRGYRHTHAWFVASVAVDKLLAPQLALLQENNSADEGVAGTSTKEQITGNSGETDFKNLSANRNSDNLANLHQLWLEKVKNHGFPQRLVFAVLVESDEQVPYREGSRDAGPVVKQILDWMMGK